MKTAAWGEIGGNGMRQTVSRFEFDCVVSNTLFLENN